MRRISSLGRMGRVFARQAGYFANGLRFGFVYLRARGFEIPRAVRSAGKLIRLQYPAEAGVKSDFVGIFIHNSYGLHRRLAQVRTIVDIGANVGFFSVAARGRYPDATIHSYEPNPRVLPFLNSNLSGLGVVVYQEAVGFSDGFVDITDNGPSNQVRTSASDCGKIAMVGFERVIQRIGGQVDLLKLDCEGAEWDLFQLSACWKAVHNIRMEYHLFHGETFPEVEENLGKLGFTVIQAQHNAGFGIIWAARSN